MVDSMTPAQRSSCMSRIRSKDTKPEITLRRALFARGLRFRTSVRLRGKPDVVFTKARLAVFVDGCFWHGCPTHGTRPKSNTGYWNPKIETNMERDRTITAALKAEGWRVLRYWDHDIKDHLGKVVAEIEAEWRSAINGPSESN